MTNNDVVLASCDPLLNDLIFKIMYIYDFICKEFSLLLNLLRIIILLNLLRIIISLLDVLSVYLGTIM